jgi:hypothetical protein
MLAFLKPLSDAAYPGLTVTYTGTAGVTAAVPAGPQGVLVWSTTDAYVIVGEGVTATTANGTPIPAFTPIPFEVPRGTGSPWRVSAIQVSAGGSIYCKPLNVS